MELSLLILIPLIGGLLAWVVGRGPGRGGAARWIALGATGVNLVLALSLWARFPGAVAATRGAWVLEEQRAWLPRLGVSYHLGLDGLSLLMILLTTFIGVVAVLVSWREIHERVGLFHGVLLWVLTGINGVFLALDLFLFYFFWEVMLVPMYFLIGLWGHERRIYAAIKFFLFTLASGLLMLVAIVGLYVLHGRATGVYTFDYPRLLATMSGAGIGLSAASALSLMLGFFIAFAVKLPAVPVHNWLPDAHTEAPTAGSLVLAALLLKTGAYGLIRFVVPLFPDAAHRFAPVAMLLGAIGIVYGAVVAFAQTDLKRLVAYTSVSHMGFVLLGVFAWNELALQGAIVQMLCHGISTGALFILVGMLYERLHTRDMDRMSGLWKLAPRMGAMMMIFALASLGLPGLGNFVGEFLVLVGAYRAAPVPAIIAAIGVVFATVYSLWMVQRVFHGRATGGLESLADLTRRELLVLAALIVVIVWLGIYPQPVLETARQTLAQLGALAGS